MTAPATAPSGGRSRDRRRSHARRAVPRHLGRTARSAGTSGTASTITSGGKQKPANADRERLLVTAQRYAVVREQQTRQFTLGWPLLRRCARRLAGHLQHTGVLADPPDVFFLTRVELTAGLAGEPISPAHQTVQERRAAWQRHRRLAAPLELGTPTGTGPPPLRPVAGRPAATLRPP